MDPNFPSDTTDGDRKMNLRFEQNCLRTGT